MIRERRRLRDDGGAYFTVISPKLQFVSSGCSVLDCVLGGGWPLGRIVNVIGDQSSGKTLLAIEAMANFAKKYPEGKIRYNESEAAFLPEYAAALGLPIDRVGLTRSETVEKFYEDLVKFLDGLDGVVGIYVLDSLDALSDEAEVGRAFGQESYGTGKAKQMSQLFRRATAKVEASSVGLMIISQTRDRIGGTFGRKYTRSGGRALDFYASVIVYLAHLRELTRTVRGVKRSTGVEIKAKCTKNKIGLPFRNCTFPIVFGYGVEDITAGLDWLEEHKMLETVGLTAKESKDLRTKALRIQLETEDYDKWRVEIPRAVRKGWREVEQSFLPVRRKY